MVSAIVVASRPPSASCPVVSSLPVLALQAAGVVVPALHGGLPQGEGKYVGVATARSGSEFAAAEMARYGWALADWAQRWADDSRLADLVRDGWAPAERSAGSSPDGWFPAGCSSARVEQHCSPDAPSAH